MKTKKAIALTTIVATLTVGSITTKIPQDVVKIRKYNNQIEKALTRHEWLVNDIRSAYTDTTSAYEIVKEELAIRISEKITMNLIMQNNMKKVITVYKNKTMSKLLDMYSNMKARQRLRKKEKEAEKPLIYITQAHNF